MTGSLFLHSVRVLTTCNQFDYKYLNFVCSINFKRYAHTQQVFFSLPPFLFLRHYHFCFFGGSLARLSCTIIGATKAQATHLSDDSVNPIATSHCVKTFCPDFHSDSDTSPGENDRFTYSQNPANTTFWAANLHKDPVSGNNNCNSL